MDQLDIEQIINRTIQLAKTDNRESKLVSTVRGWSGSEADQKIISTIAQKGSKSFLKFAVKHGDHIHIVHDCVFSAGSCRCWQFHATRRYTPKHLCRELTKENWRALFSYHVFDWAEREVLYFKIGTTDLTADLLSRFEILRSNESEHNGDTTNRSMETCNGEQQILHRFDNPEIAGDFDILPSYDETNEVLLGSGTSRKRKAPWGGAAQEETQEIYNKLVDICASPICDGDRSMQWCDPRSKLKFQNNNSLYVKNAKSALHLYFQSLTLRGFRDFYARRTTQPIWGADSTERFFEKYFSLETSIYKAMQLLIFQTTPHGGLIGDKYEINEDHSKWEYNLYDYIRELVHLLDKKTGKANTHYYVSPSNAGKTTWMDCIRDYLLSHGNMSNWNRYSRFPCQMIVDKRVAFWNEPNCEESAYEELKKLLGGGR